MQLTNPETVEHFRQFLSKHTTNYVVQLEQQIVALWQLLGGFL